MEFAIPFLFAGVILFAVFVRLMAGSMDVDRIDEYIRERGGRIIEKHWTPFGKGWFGEKDSRIYRVIYEDAQGNLHEATCKTGMFSGVYFTEDQIVQKRQRRKNREDDATSRNMTTQGDHDVASLQEENRQLREEIERLRRQSEHDA